MLDNKSFLAIIPARGGSKRLPRKNVLPINDKPMIVYTIEAAKKSKYLDGILLSSDDLEILNIAKEFRIDRIKRSKELAQDDTSTFDAVEDIISKLEKRYDYIVLLQPTSPLRNSQHIDEAIEELSCKKADCIVSVCEMEHSPLWSNVLPKDGSMENFIKKSVVGKRSQDLEKYYRINGAIYIVEVKKFLQEKSFILKKNIYSYIMDKKDSIDIDDSIDFIVAKSFMENDNG